MPYVYFLWFVFVRVFLFFFFSFFFFFFFFFFFSDLGKGSLKVSYRAIDQRISPPQDPISLRVLFENGESHA